MLSEVLRLIIIKVPPRILLKDITFILLLASALTGLKFSLVNTIKVKAAIRAVA